MLWTCRVAIPGREEDALFFLNVSRRGNVESSFIAEDGIDSRRERGEA